jgi:hypothetical protein
VWTIGPAACSCARNLEMEYGGADDNAVRDQAVANLKRKRGRLRI